MQLIQNLFFCRFDDPERSLRGLLSIRRDMFVTTAPTVKGKALFHAVRDIYEQVTGGL